MRNFRIIKTNRFLLINNVLGGQLTFPITPNDQKLLNSKMWACQKNIKIKNNYPDN